MSRKRLSRQKEATLRLDVRRGLLHVQGWPAVVLIGVSITIYLLADVLGSWGPPLAF